jgi:uncharacterized damage-inducible protein DinB
MAHVLDLLGCVVRGPTTEATLEAVPAAIRAYRRFMKRCGEAVDLESSFTTVVVEHVMEGPWLGNGNPTGGFAPDFQVLSSAELSLYLRRLACLQNEYHQLLRELSPRQLGHNPESGGWPISRILHHVAESQYAYLRSALGPVKGLPAAVRAVREGREPPPVALDRVWEMSIARLEAMTELERKRKVQRGQVTWTAWRALRRMLEHGWEHLVQVAEHLGKGDQL